MTAKLQCDHCGAVIEARLVGSFVSDPAGKAVRVCAEHVPLLSAKLARDPVSSAQRADSLRAVLELHEAGSVLLFPRRPA